MSAYEHPYIFGIHESKGREPGEKPMIEMKKHGWIVFPEGISDDPQDHQGKDYRPWTECEQPFGVIARLNNGYDGAGNIPRQERYAAFAVRCGNFAAASQGCGLWIIGNEMNLPDEWDGSACWRDALFERIVALLGAGR